MSRTVLLTGFAAFDGQQENASWLAVQRAAEGWSGPGALLTTLLPVSFADVGPALDQAIATHHPEVVICAGLAQGRARIGLERTAVNVIDSCIPDQDGWSPIDEPVVVGGPVGYLSTLPIKACVAELAAAQVPAEISNSAGTYVCNGIFYWLLHRLRSTPEVRGGFVHVPQATEIARSDAPTLALDVLARGLSVIARTTISVRHDLRRASGSDH